MRGIETAVLLGVGGLSDMSGLAFTRRSQTAEYNFSPGPAFQLLWGYHLTRWLSAGLHLGYSFHPATVLPAVATSGHADVLMIGAYMQLYVGSLLGWRRLEPIVSIGIDPAAGLWQTYRRNETAILTNVAASDAWAGLGLEYNVSESVALGFAAQAQWWLPHSRCATVATTDIIECPSEPLVSNSYFFAGISARFTM